MAEEQVPFLDVRPIDDGFSIPELKWRELLFVGALRQEGDGYVRDPSRPLPLFAIPNLFPEDTVFHVTRAGGRIEVRAERPGPPSRG